jgi:2-oxoglutarate ferredoxin oxidoreductase subunit gamma
VKVEIRVAGFGGQGVAVAGYILGKAASLYQGLEAVMTQAYGPEARGGASSSDIILADAPIDYPFLAKADVLVVLSQEAYARFRPQARPEAIILIDEGLVTADPEDQPHRIPATALAEGLGRRLVANVVMLGFFCATTGIIQRQALEESIRTTVPERTIPLNLQAFALGYEHAPEAEPVR